MTYQSIEEVDRELPYGCHNSQIQLLLTGVNDLCEPSPLPSIPSEVPYRLDDARQAVRTLLSLAKRPTAVVCGNDVIAYGVMLEAERQGLVLPDELSVMGFDDLEWSRHLRPSLTTMHVPTDEVWTRAGDYLVRTFGGLPATLHHEVYVSLVVRESTAPLRAAKRR